MRSLYVFGVVSIVAGFMSALLTLPARAAEPSLLPREEGSPPASVIISEINWAGSGRSSADEWLELANLTGAPIDVGGWIVSGVATNAGAITLADGSSIAPLGTLVIANYTVGDQSTLAVAPDLVTTAVSIPNTKLSILLATPDGTVVDSLEDPGTPDFGSSIAPIASMERDVVTLGWFSASTSSNLFDGQLGSPGTIGSSALVPPDEETPTVNQPIDEITALDDSETPVPETPHADEEPSDPANEASEPATEAAPAPEEVVAGGNDAAPPITDEQPDSAPSGEDPVDYTIDTTHEAPPSDPSDEDLSSPPNTASNEEPVKAAPAETATKTTLSAVGNIRLNEFVSSPASGDEWIELFNADNVAVDLTGWTVRDASGKATPLSGTLAAGAYFVISKPLGKLNNDVDSIELRDASGAIVDVVTYGTGALAAPKSGESAAWYMGSWQLTAILTAGAANSIPAVETTTGVGATELPESEEVIYETDSSVTATADHNAATSTEHSGTAAKAATASTTKTVSIVATAKPVASSTTKKSTTTTTKKATSSSNKTAAKTPTRVTEITTAADGAFVQFTGTVIAIPGTFGTQVAYLQGAALYLHSANWPQLAVGDTVEVTGTISTSRGEKRIKLSNAEDIRIIGHEEVTATPITDLGSVTTASLVTIEGEVIARNGDKLVLRMGTTDVTVTAYEKTGITWSGLSSSRVRITGVLKRTTDAVILMPRSTDDVVHLTTPTAEETLSLTVGTSLPIEPIIGGGLLISAAGAIGYWYIRSRKLIPSLAS